MDNKQLIVPILGLNLDFIYPKEFDFSNNDRNHFIEIIKKTDRIPFSKGDILYSSNIWDFENNSILYISILITYAFLFLSIFQIFS